MGCFFSSLLSAVDDSWFPTAMVVTTDGSLIEYDTGITAAEVIAQTARDFALCNSDKIFFDSYPQAAPPGEELEPGQIYFLIPATDLRRRLTGEVVLELAIRASEALQKAQEKHGKRRKIKVAPGAAEVFHGDSGGGGGNFIRRWTAAEWNRMDYYNRMDGNGFVKLRKKLSAVEEVDDEGGINLLLH